MTKLSYSYEEAAEATGFSISVIKQAAQDGFLVRRYGGRGHSKPVIPASSLQSWLDSLPDEKGQAA